VHESARRRLLTALLLGAGIIVLASSLRAGVASIGVLLPDIRAELGMGPASVGLLTTLPVLCFAIVGIGAGGVILRVGVHRATVLLLGAIVIGLVARAVTHSTTAFLLATTVAMAGTALGNVVLPPLAKQHFPRRVPLISALYGAALMGGASLAAATTAPLEHAFGDWRIALGIWAIPALVGMVLWLPTALHDRPARRIETTGPVDRAIPLRSLTRSRLAWAMAICFGAQSSQAYVQFGYWGEILGDQGVSQAHAGALLGIIALVGIPVALLLPTLARLTRGTVTMPIVFGAVTIIGWTGILTAPEALGDGVGWAIVLGIGGGAFPWCLAMIGVGARTRDGSAQLSAFTQGIGYAVAAATTFSAGLLREATGSWTVPLAVLMTLAVVIAVAGSVAMRSRHLEDELSVG
jgi:CP family cyanate transporter-like MFS transporter